MNIRTLFRLFTFCILYQVVTLNGQTTRSVILDADTANEVDDLFAIFYLLSDSTVTVNDLNATQWQSSQWATERTMEDSHRLNSLLTSEMGISIPLRRGGEGRMHDWGNKARYSDATNNIIEQARKATREDKLTIIALGALTNVASAIFIAPEIQDRIELFWLGTTYDFDQGILRKNDFNCMMDIQALDILLHSTVEMTIIPINIASKCVFDYRATEEIFRGEHNLGNYLMDTWYHHKDAGRKSRTLWDLSLVYAYLNSDRVAKQTVRTSKDNGGRMITLIKDYDNDLLTRDLFSRYERWKN